MRHFLTIIMLAVLAVGNFSTSAYGKTTSSNRSTTPATNKYGFYNVLNCPTSSSSIKATTEEKDDEGYNVNIYRGQTLAQTILCEDVTSGDVHDFDANFDGNLDIIVGPAASRNCSIILLWNEKDGKFEKMSETEGLNGNLLVNPKKKIIVSQASGSYCSEYYTKYIWQGNRLIPTETLIEILDPKAYSEYGVKHRYTIIVGADEDNISSSKTLETDKKAKLPLEWRQIINSYDF